MLSIKCYMRYMSIKLICQSAFFLMVLLEQAKLLCIRLYCMPFRGKCDQAIAVASTGIAATFLSGGRTAHSIFKIPLTLNATSTCNLKPNSSEAKILLDAKVIVWDEAPMTHVHAFLAVDRLLKDLTKCDEPFGGKIILLGGDFRQVLPVILRGSRSLTVSSCIKKIDFGLIFSL
ncbi:hypothetical protein AVEN_271070-1 [Araneus ventricosus]|uniref:ATP-dependent DNA helicase n=1 Tax=Araneus ventricosus TaxID=182803 RepID=A0A4Y2FC98_ARAVE|nr:hypothetical protein AVEN_271070-1 [Araneus ventricosus]